VTQTSKSLSHPIPGINNPNPEEKKKKKKKKLDPPTLQKNLHIEAVLKSSKPPQ
jgi:hypothetical protein